MALTISDIAENNSTTLGATLSLTGVTAAIGDMLVLACAADNNGTSGVSSTSATITDAAGNTWTRQSETNRTPGGAASDGTTLSIWTAPITAALSSATITINFSPDTTSKVAILKKAVCGSGENIVFVGDGSGVTGAGTTQDAGTVSVDESNAIIGYTAAETSDAVTGDSDTTNGTWSSQQTARANTGTNATSQRIAGQHKIATAAGNQNYDTTTVSSRDYAVNYLVLGIEADVTLAAAGEIELDGEVPTVGTTGNTTLDAAGAIELAGLVPNVTTSTNIIVAAPGRVWLIGYTPTVTPGVSWPAALPRPLLATHAFVPRPQVLRTEMEQGAARVRRLSRVTPHEAPFSLHLDQEQMAILEAWVDYVGDYGGRYFSIRLMSPTGYRTHEVRFMGEIDYKQVRKDRWLATGTFETEERPMMTEAELDALIGETS